MLFFLRQETVLIKPAKADARRRTGHVLHGGGNNIPQLGLGFPFIHVGLQANKDVAVTPLLQAVGLLFIDLEMAAPLLDALPDKDDAAFLIAIAPHMPAYLQDRCYRDPITLIH
ncbi:MAG: hypothetical protein ACRD9L_23020 [Bryobacteraceae bacterium]